MHNSMGEERREAIVDVPQEHDSNDIREDEGEEEREEEEEVGDFGFLKAYKMPQRRRRVRLLVSSIFSCLYISTYSVCTYNWIRTVGSRIDPSSVQIYITKENLIVDNREIGYKKKIYSKMLLAICEFF